MRTLRPSLILALLALPLGAQSPGFSAGGGVILGLDSLRKATHTTLGYTAGADYTTHLPGTEVPGRVGLSYTALPGTEKYGLKTSLGLAQLHADGFLGAAESPLQAFLGISLNRYSMTRSGTEDTADELDIDHHFPVRDVKGLKLGFRIGLAWAFQPHLTAELMLSQTELAGKDLEDPLVRQGGINPAWFQLVMNYRF